MSGSRSQPQWASDFVLRIAPLWVDRFPDVLAALQALGARVGLVAEDHHSVSGIIPTDQLHELGSLPCVEGVVAGAEFLLDAGDPADRSDPLEATGSPGPGDAQDEADQRPSASRAMRFTYGVVVALAGGLLLLATLAEQELSGVQRVNIVVCAGLLMIFATLAALGPGRHRTINYACTGLGLWLAASACFLPHPSFCVDVVIGVTIFLLAGSAGEAMSQPEQQPSDLSR